MALNSVHGSLLSSASAEVLTTSRHPHHYPQSNGHAEAGVKAILTLIVKTTANGNLDTESFTRGLLEWRNTPRPAARARLNFFLVDHSPHSSSPTVATSTTQVDSTDSVPGEQLPPSPRTTGCILPNIPLGTHVHIQDPTSKLWARRGVIVGIGRHRDNNIKLPSGRILCRNRRCLRPRIPAIPIPSHDQPAPTPSVSPSASRSSSSQPRRSNRRRQPPTRLNIANTHGQSYV